MQFNYGWGCGNKLLVTKIPLELNIQGAIMLYYTPSTTHHRSVVLHAVLKGKHARVLLTLINMHGTVTL